MSEIAVSVVIPTHDRPEQLARCLRALASTRQADGGLEVVVVNDGGGPPAPLTAAAAGDGIVLRVIEQARSGPAAARNAGAAAARGSVLAFTDDDCEATPEWLEALVDRLDRNPDAVVGGRMVSLDPDNAWATASQLLTEHLYRWYNRDPDHARFVTSNNLGMTAATFRALGGFHTGFPSAAAEDRELAERTLRSGRPLVFAADAVVGHRHRLSAVAFVRQHWGYGRGAYRVLRVRRQAGGGMFFEPLGFYARMIRRPFEEHRGLRGLWLGVLLVISQVAHTAGFLRQALLGGP